MVKINVFLQSASRHENNLRAGLLAFYQGLKNAGEDVDLVTEARYAPCDVAVIYGCLKEGTGTIETRRNICEAHDGTLVVLETPFLGRRIRREDKGLRAFIRRLRNKRTIVDVMAHFRVGLNGPFYNTGDFCNAGSPADRWELLRREFDLDLKPYRTTGSHVLIIGQIPDDGSLQGADIIAWLEATVRAVKQRTARPIVVRPHPGTRPRDLKRMMRSLTGDRQVHVDLPPTGTIHDALADCWVCVTYSSSASVDALLMGVPAIAMSPASIAWPVTDHDLAAVENPTLYPREQWLYDLCYAQWSPAEMASGIVWPRLRNKAYHYLAQSKADGAQPKTHVAQPNAGAA